MGLTTHRPPATCPVCSQALITLRLGCPSCGTEVSGHFGACRYCRLDPADSQVLEVFLRSRGNVREVQAHLGVSYPTARARLGEVLARLGLGDEPTGSDASAARSLVGPGPAPIPPTTPGPDVATVLADLAAGRMSVDEAARVLGA